MKVTVPAATFDCIEYTTFCENGEIAVIEYYAVNIGLIKCTYYVFGKISTASILLDYHIK